jgi:molybdopterin-guanine dinucleotide biosynthesis protein A
MISSRDLTAVILAGGKTQKAGGPVASNLEVDGRRVIERQAQILKSKVSRIEVSVSAPVTWSRFPVTLDEFEPIGPLAGIATSLKYASTDYILAVASDLAWINPDALDLLIARSGEPFDACAIRFNFANPNPLFAIYHKRCAQRAIDRLERGDHTAMGLLTSESLAVRWIEDYELQSFDPEMATFKKVELGIEPTAEAPKPSAISSVGQPASSTLAPGDHTFAFQAAPAYQTALAVMPLVHALAKLDPTLGGELTRAATAVLVAAATGGSTQSAACACAAVLDAMRAVGVADSRIAEAQALLGQLA